MVAKDKAPLEPLGLPPALEARRRMLQQRLREVTVFMARLEAWRAAEQKAKRDAATHEKARQD